MMPITVMNHPLFCASKIGVKLKTAARKLVAAKLSPGTSGAAQHQALSRNSRRKILPTGVLGNSVRNSITRGCL
jgi:hypothetical protein